jgi:hypothetical protein
MRLLALTLLLAPAALFAGQARFARLGEFDGKVEVQLQAADPWMPAERNLPLLESTWVRTGAASRVELELDDGSSLRLGPDSLAEISDYCRLSTGQRVTLLSLDRGVAYFTGEPRGADSLSVAVPGAQLVLTRGVRIRLQAVEHSSSLAVIEGMVRFSSPRIEVDIAEGQTLQFDPANASRFKLDREVAAVDLDAWSEARDKALATPSSAAHVSEPFGVADLDQAGEWIQTDDLGAVWKPKIPQGWAPYQNGRWRWYDALGYTWVGDDAWGWLPYHFGRWTRREALGWVWAPSTNHVFKPAEVFWMRGSRLAGWGPLAPGEQWAPSAQPLQFLAANTTFAAWVQDARVIDPAGFTGRPKEPLAVTVFALALPSPAFIPARLEAVRPPLRVGSTRVMPVIQDVTYGTAREREIVAELPPPVVRPPVEAAPPPPEPAPLPDDVYYPAPSYTGVVVVNPPEHPDYSRRPRPSGQPQQPKPPETSQGSGSQQPAARPTPAPRSSPPEMRIDRPMPRGDAARAPHETPNLPAPSAAPAAHSEQPAAPVATQSVHSAAPPAPARSESIQNRQETHQAAAPAPAPRVEPRQETKSESKPEAKTEPKTESKSEAKSEPAQPAAQSRGPRQQ